MRNTSAHSDMGVLPRGRNAVSMSQLQAGALQPGRGSEGPLSLTPMRAAPRQHPSCTHSHTHTHTHKYICMHIFNHIHPHTIKVRHTYKDMHTYETLIDRKTDTRTHAHTHTHTHTHTSRR